jgi:hypothetical protein
MPKPRRAQFSLETTPYYQCVARAAPFSARGLTYWQEL